MSSGSISARAGGTPLFSVITVVRNRADLVDNCTSSVRRQRGVALEHIVIDGASTDGTAEILGAQAASFAYFRSEPDSGIADAMNKGLLQTSGEWVLFLHADDELISDDALLQVRAVLEGSASSIVGFPILFGDEHQARRIEPRGGNPWMRLKTGFLHQATFVRRSVFEDIGGFDTSLRVAMDYDFFLRAWVRKIPMSTCSKPLPTLMRNTGISSRTDWSSLQQRLAEERRVHLKNSTSRMAGLLYWCYWSAYLPYRALIAWVRR